jgi:hypothetical protein
MSSVAVVMPTIPRRAASAQAVIAALSGQCDRFYVHLDGYSEVPTWLPSKHVRCFVHPQNRGPAVRYSVVPEEDVVLFVDDDLAHPEDYVRRSVRALRRAGKNHAIAYHAAWWRDGAPPSYGSRQLVGYWSEAADDQVVTYVGSGTLGICSDDLRRVDRNVPVHFAYEDDVWISSALSRAGIRCVRPRSNGNWIGSTSATRDGLYAEACKDGFRRRDQRIAEALAMGGWRLTR